MSGKLHSPRGQVERKLLVPLGFLALLIISAPGITLADPAPAYVMSEDEKQTFKQARLYGVERRDDFAVWAEAYLDRVAERLSRLESVASAADSSSIQGFTSTLRASRMQLQNLRDADDGPWIARHRVFAETVDDVERLSARLQLRIDPSSSTRR